jgi:hypothetical protein
MNSFVSRANAPKNVAISDTLPHREYKNVTALKRRLPQKNGWGLISAFKEGKRMARIIFVLWMVVSCLLGGTAFATTIVDTGPTPTSFLSTVGLSNDGTNIYYLAAQFTTNTAHTITDIQGYMSNDTSFGVTAAISKNFYDNYLPAYRPGDHIFSASFNVGSTETWYGLSGLDWALPAGTYWIVFEPLVGFSGSMPLPFPNPLAPTAFYYSGNPYPWSSYPYAAWELGIRIYDNTPVPLPGAVWLLGSGLLGLAGLRRKFKK